MAITPFNTPERFNETERHLWAEGKCCYQTAYGIVTERSRPGNVEYCEEPSTPGADYGYCLYHALNPKG